jgi:hypothetical protein
MASANSMLSLEPMRSGTPVRKDTSRQPPVKPLSTLVGIPLTSPMIWPSSRSTRSPSTVRRVHVFVYVVVATAVAVAFMLLILSFKSSSLIASSDYNINNVHIKFLG